MRSARVLGLLIIGVAAFGSGCVRRVNVNEQLPVSEALSTDQLISRINSYNEIRTFSAQATVVVRNYFTGDGGKADEFPSATGLIRFQRPENTRMKVTFTGFQVADMVSDGHSYKLAIYRPSESRRFFFGTNLKQIEHLDAAEIRETKDKRLTEAGGLLNLRPQHITDSFLIKPIADGERINVFREELRQVETDTRPNKKKGLVERTYYVLYVLERDDSGQVKLRRKFWFDRNQPDTPLVRQQTFENGNGKLASDVTFSSWFNIPNSGRKWPGQVTIDRRNADGYRLELKLEPDTVEINSDLPDTTFKLENTERLPEVDLDHRTP
ncbi:MAG TPA: hypothetical protein VFB82_06170 [Blastocatellia bacterium]|nr:hypothetical protein [Blastocatellia bacterium]